MQSSCVTSENEVHPPDILPPPPPPLPPKFSPSTRGCKCKNTSVKDKPSKKSPKEEVISAVRHITYNFHVENPASLISLYYPVAPVIQEGRCCGIVALSMASQLIQNVTADKILCTAKSLNFTKEGEMFSAFNMASLAKSLLQCEAFVLDDLDSNRDKLLSHICDGWPLLIPYDADRNHFPCSNNGMTAHWAVITGIAFTVKNKDILRTLKNYYIIQEYPELHIFTVQDALTVKECLKHAEKIFLYAHQGKSKHLAAWCLDDLLESNKNMHEVTKKYSPDDLVLPTGDSLSELRNKSVLIKK